MSECECPTSYPPCCPDCSTSACPHVGARPFHRKSYGPTKSTLGSYVVQVWSRHTLKLPHVAPPVLPRLLVHFGLLAGFGIRVSIFRLWTCQEVKVWDLESGVWGSGLGHEFWGAGFGVGVQGLTRKDSRVSDSGPKPGTRDPEPSKSEDLRSSGSECPQRITVVGSWVSADSRCFKSAAHRDKSGEQRA